MIKASVLALVSAVSILAQGTPPERHDSVKVTKIETSYFYTLSSGETAISDNAIDVKEGSEVTVLREGDSTYIVDSDGKKYKCRIFIADPAPLNPPSKKKKKK